MGGGGSVKSRQHILNSLVPSRGVQGGVSIMSQVNKQLVRGGFVYVKLYSPKNDMKDVSYKLSLPDSKAPRTEKDEDVDG